MTVSKGKKQKFVQLQQEEVQKLSTQERIKYYTSLKEKYLDLQYPCRHKSDEQMIIKAETFFASNEQEVKKRIQELYQIKRQLQRRLQLKNNLRKISAIFLPFSLIFLTIFGICHYFKYLGSLSEASFKMSIILLFIGINFQYDSTRAVIKNSVFFIFRLLTCLDLKLLNLFYLKIQQFWKQHEHTIYDYLIILSQNQSKLQFQNALKMFKYFVKTEFELHIISRY